MWCSLNRNSLSKHDELTLIRYVCWHSGQMMGTVLGASFVLCHFYCFTVPLKSMGDMCQYQMFFIFREHMLKAKRHTYKTVSITRADSHQLLKATIYNFLGEKVTEGLERQMPLCMCVVVKEQTWYGMFWYVFHCTYQKCMSSLMGSDQTKNLRRTWW